jgi:hypothetical protein
MIVRPNIFKNAVCMDCFGEEQRRLYDGKSKVKTVNILLIYIVCIDGE